MPARPFPRVIVGLDLETTSLDPAQGEIIEVAAIRFDLTSGQELERFEQLTAASGPLSPETVALTGITDAMLAGRPRFAAVASELRKFIGDDIIFAHNVTFDLNWLTAHGCGINNPVWDTFLLASVAWPEALSYNLGTLARALNLPPGQEHRAAADIVLSFGLLQRTVPRLRFSKQTLRYIEHLLTVSGQGHYLPLFSTADTKLESRSRKAKADIPQTPVNLSVNSILGTSGRLAAVMPDFRTRASQLELAEYITNTAQAGNSAMIEAGAGIGKTYAYLAAGLSLGGRMLISTYTRVLQDQLVQKDLPQLLSALNLTRRVAALKGRRQYVCRRRLQSQLAQATQRAPDAWLLLKIVTWLDQGGSGDLESINLSHQAWHPLGRLHADHPICRRQCSQEKSSRCPYQQARQAAAVADITVINHALFVRTRAGDEELPNRYTLVIVDEAHHLEEAALSVSELDLTSDTLTETVQTLARIGDNDKLQTECQRLPQEYDALLTRAVVVLEQHTTDSRLRLSRTVRRSHSFQAFQADIGHFISRLHFAAGLARAAESTIKQENRQLYQDTVKRFHQFTLELEGWLAGSSAARVQWLEKHPQRAGVTLRDCAIDPSAYLEPTIEQATPCVLLSATLSLQGDFTYLQQRFGLKNISTKIFPAMFDYQRQMKIIVVEDGPHPISQQFDQFVAEQIEKVAKLTYGRLLALFTSKASIIKVHERLTSKLNKEQIRLFSQGLSGGRNNIANRFRDDHASVLLGAASFWEGFDSPGETLSVLVIPRLPFPQVSDPVIEALCENAGDWKAFEKVTLPRMLLRVRQGVGRLIRTEQDQGVVIFLDRRLLEKEYGADTLRSLPSAPVEILSVDHLVAAVEHYFGSETLHRWQTHTQ